MNTHGLVQLRPESLTVVVGRSGSGNPNILLSIAAEHLLEDHENNVLFLVTEEMPLTIGQRFVRYYPDVKSNTCYL
jgi:predicted ATP-dependent serine protease